MTAESLEPSVRLAVIRELMAWHAENRRDFSFRRTRDPYRVLVSEMLLRQTQAVQVESVYDDLFRRFPTVQGLAEAPPGQLSEVLRPLGIIRRAAQLVEVAEIITFRHGGRVPDSRQELMELPGVGDYVAGCVLSFGYDISEPSVDTNIVRVLSRVLGLPHRRGPRASDTVLGSYASLLQASNDRRELHHAVIDLAHAVCRHKDPRCQECPLRRWCAYAGSRGLISQ